MSNSSEEVDTNKDMDLSSGTEASLTGIQRNFDSEMGDERTYFVPPLPDSSSESTEGSEHVNDNMNNITNREEEGQEADPNLGRKREAHERQHAENLSKVSPVCKQMQREEHARVDEGGNNYFWTSK